MGLYVNLRKGFLFYDWGKPVTALGGSARDITPTLQESSHLIGVAATIHQRNGRNSWALSTVRKVLPAAQRRKTMYKANFGHENAQHLSSPKSFLQDLEPLSLTSPFNHRWTFTFSPSRATKGPFSNVTSSRCNFSQRGGKFCSCLTSTRRSPGWLESYSLGHTGRTRAMNSMDLLIRKAKIFQKWNHSFHRSLYKKLHALGVRSLVMIFR